MNQQPIYTFPNLGRPDGAVPRSQNDPIPPRGARHGWNMDKARADNLTRVIPTVGFSALPDSSGVAHPSEIAGTFKLKKNVKMPAAPGKKNKGGRKKSKVSRRLTKRKDRRKHCRTHRKKRKGSKTRRKH